MLAVIESRCARVRGQFFKLMLLLFLLQQMLHGFESAVVCFLIVRLCRDETTQFMSIAGLRWL
jgi:membrane protein required for beta-lactamase induction